MKLEWADQEEFDSFNSQRLKMTSILSRYVTLTFKLRGLIKVSPV